MPDGMWLITCGAYIGQELTVEFGRLPPAFLPVGNRRLYEYQIEALASDHPIFMTVPEGFIVLRFDVDRLTQLGAEGPTA